MSQFAVNGKVPIAVWCPSRDDAGNGTTTLNDLVGSNHGTLTAMDPATDWVADTGAGGIRALDFDGSNDHVVTSALSISGFFSVSGWVVSNTKTGESMICAMDASASIKRVFQFRVNNSRRAEAIVWNTSAQLSTCTGTSSISTSAWTHIVATWDGSSIRIYVNGTLETTTARAGTAIATHSIPLSIGARTIADTGTSPLDFLVGRSDDIRLFNQVLDSTDVSYLYNSGNGRGRLASSRRRNNIFVGALF